MEVSQLRDCTVDGTSRQVERLLMAMLALGVAMLLWVLASLGLSLFADGWLYSVESPVPVEVGERAIYAEVVYQARMDLVIYEQVELVCAFRYSYEKDTTVAARGGGVYTRRHELPQFDPHNTCRLSGLVQYRPFGQWGPTLSHTWYSENFVAGAE